MMRRALIVSWLAGAALAGAGPARAEDTGELEGMLQEKVVTAASKKAESGAATPATTISISADQIRRYGLRTVADAIRFLSLGATTSETAQRSEFGAGGVSISNDWNSHVLVLVDGHATNDGSYGSAHIDRGLGVPIELIDHIELILGPGSVLYGSNAMLAIVNIVTKRAKDFRGGHVYGDIDAFGNIDFVTQYRGAAGIGKEFELGGQTGELTLGVEYIHYKNAVEIEPVDAGLDFYTGRPIRFSPGGPQDGIWGGTWHNYYEYVPAGYARVIFGDFQLSLGARSDNRNHPTLNFDFDHPDSREHTRQAMADLKYTKTLSAVVDLSFRVYADTWDTRVFYRSSAPLYCLPGQSQGCKLDSTGTSRWIGSDAQLHFDWLSDGRITSLVGVDARWTHNAYLTDSIDAATGDNPGSLSYYSDGSSRVGLYAQNITELTPELTFNFGARFDAEADVGSAVSPRAAAIIAPWESATVKAIYSSAFRAPTITERKAGHPLFLAPAGDLEPETVRYGELSFEQRFGAQRILVAVFRSEWHDVVLMTHLKPEELAAAKDAGLLLRFTPDGRRFTNAAEIQNYGMNFGYEGTLALDRLAYGLHLTAAHARLSLSDASEDTLLPGSPQFFGNAQISYDLKSPLPTLSVAASYQEATSVFNTDTSTYPNPQFSKSRLRLLANITGPVPGLGGVSYRLSAERAFGDESPFAIGPVRSYTPEEPEPALAPLEELRVSAGLGWDFEL